MSADSKTEYERIQEFNPFISWLHSRRCGTILALCKELAHNSVGAPINFVDIGCADAKLFPLLDKNVRINYTGIELGQYQTEVARSRYSQHANFRVINDSVTNVLPLLRDADIVAALETLEHIPEHEVVRIVEAIASYRPKYFACSVPVEIGPAVWLKNVGSFVTGYIRHKEYRWRETFWAGLYQLDKLPPHQCGHAGFDWRWLAHTIRHNMRIVELHKLPFDALPAAVAFSVFFVAVPRPGYPLTPPWNMETGIMYQEKSCAMHS